MRTIAILNPAADHGQAGKKRDVVAAALRAAGLSDDIRLTQGPGHAETLARQAAGEADLVVAVGGDGTVHEVCRGLIGQQPCVPLGVIPLGTGNDFIKMLGMDRRPSVAARQLAAASPVKIDYGRVRWQTSSTSGEQIFVNAVGIGFDAHVAARAAAFKFLPGVVGYLVAALQTVRRWEAPAVRVTGPAEAMVYEGRLLLVTVGNGVCSGGMFYLTPSALITDGLLDLCLVERASFLRVLRLLPLAVQGRHEPEPEVRTGRFRTLRVTAEAGLPIHTDGEVQVLNAHTIDVEIIPAGLSVLMQG